MKVCTSKTAWKGFLRRAKKAHPLEHMEALWGYETVDTFRIVKFAKVELTEQTKTTIDYTRKEIEKQKKLAKAEGLQFIGTIHTHPHIDHDYTPSEDDHIYGVKFGEKLMGIVHLYKPSGKNPRFNCMVRWWFPQEPLEFNILPE